MKATDRRFLCTALGMTIILLRNGSIPPGDQTVHALGIADLIELFCRATEQRPSGEDRIALANRMATVIADIIREKQFCSPDDLLTQGFTQDEVDQCWVMSRALAAVGLEV